jgi:hypothetical protein
MAGEVKRLYFPDGVAVTAPTDFQNHYITQWATFTPLSFTTLGGATITVTQSKYRRVGENFEGKYSLTFGGAASTTFGPTLNSILPSGLTNGAVFNGPASLDSVPIGWWSARDESAADTADNFSGTVELLDDGTLRFCTATTDYLTNTVPFTWASTDAFTFTIDVPISEWIGGGVANTLIQNNLTDWTDYAAPGTSSWSDSAVSVNYKRIGDSIKLRGSSTVGTPSGTFTWTPTNLLPNGITINEAKLSADVLTDNGPLGTWYAYDGTTQWTGVVTYDRSANTFLFKTVSEGSITTTVPTGSLWTAGDTIGWDIEVPVTEWEGQNSLVGFAEATADNMGLVGPLGDTTAQINSGQWVATNIGTNSNIAATVFTFGMYIRVGNIVYFQMRCTAQTTANNTATAFTYSLPIASTFTSVNQLGASVSTLNTGATIIWAGSAEADTTNHGIRIRFRGDTTNTNTFYWVTGSYVIT